MISVIVGLLSVIYISTYSVKSALWTSLWVCIRLISVTGRPRDSECKSLRQTGTSKMRTWNHRTLCTIWMKMSNQLTPTRYQLQFFFAFNCTFYMLLCSLSHFAFYRVWNKLLPVPDLLYLPVLQKLFSYELLKATSSSDTRYTRPAVHC